MTLRTNSNINNQYSNISYVCHLFSSLVVVFHLSPIKNRSIEIQKQIEWLDNTRNIITQTNDIDYSITIYQLKTYNQFLRYQYDYYGTEQSV